MPRPRCELLTLFRAHAHDDIECRNAACGTLLSPAKLFPAHQGGGRRERETRDRDRRTCYPAA
ncbi:hypothetical protein ACFOSC_06845 [Streptantibioticus rubrisoli]|uniref:hypothetical protein n=1 Tax=Streptantibioticus rubrisoli TaxID=1387313 RepID=UPI00210D061C|nr:hypothetical protein [Streptantibioticus rubrisoli]